MSPPIPHDPIEFNGLRAQLQRLRTRIENALVRVLDHGIFILGPEVQELEDRLAEFAGVRHAITCANGTDALALALMAIQVKADDAIFLPSFTFAATVEPVCALGSSPVFVDVLPETFNMDPEHLRHAIALARRKKLVPRAIIAVDLFGQPADYSRIEAIAKEERVFLICDSAQAFGAKLGGRRVGQFGTMTTTSFFPSKPLGCFGDGGAIFTDDDAMAELLRSLRVHGQGADKYDNVRIGTNSRLDTVQAAILLEKLIVFSEEVATRNVVALRYQDDLREILTVPTTADGTSSVWAQYTVRYPERDALSSALNERGIPTAVYYRRPLHQQQAYERFVLGGQTFSISERLAEEVLSLPMSAYLSAEDQDRVIAEVLRCAGRAVA